MFLWIQRVFFGKVWEWEDEELGESVVEETEQVPLESGGDF
jgi:hypothetical protein